jgi:hypothetical protein
MRWSVLILCVVGLAFGCAGPKGPPRKTTARVTGKVTVDGQAPAQPVIITCHNSAGAGTETPTVPISESGPDGSFEVGTYEKGDGVPAGDYVLTFESREFKIAIGDSTSPDLLKGRYSDPKKSEVKFSVKDKPVDLGEIKLTTK